MAVFYDDLGQTVPPPGLVRLGAVDGGLDAIAAAGNRVRSASIWSTSQLLTAHRRPS